MDNYVGQQPAKTRCVNTAITLLVKDKVKLTCSAVNSNDRSTNVIRPHFRIQPHSRHSGLDPESISKKTKDSTFRQDAEKSKSSKFFLQQELEAAVLVGKKDQLASVTAENEVYVPFRQYNWWSTSKPDLTRTTPTLFVICKNIFAKCKICFSIYPCNQLSSN
jgi:hypothetical protein